MGHPIPAFASFDYSATSFVLALMSEQFQRAFGFFVRGRNFLLHLGGSLFHFLREPDIAVVLHARARAPGFVVFPLLHPIKGKRRRSMGTPAPRLRFH
jgi:hypothetical protein